LPVRDRERRRSVRRRRAVALSLLLGVVLAAVAIAAGGGSAPRPRPASDSRPLTPATTTGVPASAARTATTPRATTATTAPRPRAYAVGELSLHLIDGTRTIRLPSGRDVPRTLDTIVRYPAVGAAGGGDLPGAPPATGQGPFPLIVFGHGFAVTPGPYARLLRAWASAGYVVVAPVFPLGNANAPGGPNENDLPNQPADMSFVISSLLAANTATSSRLHGLIAPRQIAVSGQSDGGDTALGAAYDPRFRDARIRAAVILSGAEIPFLSPFRIALGSPPLLATQGTADTINPPSDTQAFYDSAPRPKFLLQLLGASHLPPYTYQEPQLRIIERVTIAFLDRCLKHLPGARTRMFTAGERPGVATLSAGR
jgi:dienelactone hydrolase